MKKKIIRLTESDLQKIIENSVRRIITENEENEVSVKQLYNRGKSAIKGAMNGYASQKSLDRDNTDYTVNSRMSPNEAPSNDAVESCKKMYNLAREYDAKSKQLIRKARSIAKTYGLKQSKDNKGLNTYDYDVSTEYKGKVGSIRDRHDNYASEQLRNGNNKRQGIGKP